MWGYEVEAMREAPISIAGVSFEIQTEYLPKKKAAVLLREPTRSVTIKGRGTKPKFRFCSKCRRALQPSSKNGNRD